VDVDPLTGLKQGRLVQPSSSGKVPIFNFTNAGMRTLKIDDNNNDSDNGCNSCCFVWKMMQACKKNHFQSLEALVINVSPKLSKFYGELIVHAYDMLASLVVVLPE
jgi:hypothetical protein